MRTERRHFYQFGAFGIDTVERRLLRGAEPVPLTPKAYEILLALVENAGHGLEKDELMQRVWPDTFVEESSLTRNISVLRKVLEDEDGRYIETIPKRGYRFVAPVTEVRPPAESEVVDEHASPRMVIEETESASRHVLPLRLAAILLLLSAAAAFAYFVTRGGTLPAIRSLAVLPLKDVSGGADEKHLELGVADSIIERISEIEGLIVRPTSAVRRYMETSTDSLRAGRELKVDAVLEGTLQVAGGRIRVSLNLLETSRGGSLWAQAFDVPLNDIFQVEDEVARQVVRQLRLRLDTVRQARLTRHSTSNAEAYEHYLKGLYSNEAPRASGRARIDDAIARFRKATELDPSYAQAWAQLASCYYQLVTFYQPDGDFAEEARNAASRAYALDPDLPELLIYRAQTLWSWNSHYQIEEAIRELRRGAASNSSAVHSFLGVLYSHAGLDELAVSELKRAIEIDPASALNLDRLAQAYVWAGRYDEARTAYERAFAIESELGGTLDISAIPFLYAHQFDEARRRLERAHASDTRHLVLPAYLALLSAVEGKFPEAEAAIPSDVRQMEKFRDAHRAFYAFASIYALQGKSAKAVRWLRKTVEGGWPHYPMFARDSNLDPVRSSPEFVQFMAELKPRYEAMERLR